MAWISVDDRLPPHGSFNLCWFDSLFHTWGIEDGGIDHNGTGHHKHMLVRQLTAKDGVRWANEGVTHWWDEPLPQPPAD